MASTVDKTLHLLKRFLDVHEISLVHSELTNSVEQSPSSEADSHSANQENSPPFMEPEGSLPYLQKPATNPYCEPDESSPHLPTLFS